MEMEGLTINPWNEWSSLDWCLRTFSHRLFLEVLHAVEWWSPLVIGCDSVCCWRCRQSVEEAVVSMARSLWIESVH